MTSIEIQDLFGGFFTFHYGKVQEALQSGTLTFPPGVSILFPTILLFTETKNHYIVELFGASQKFAGLCNKRHKETSVNRYVSQLSQDESQAHLRVDAAFVVLEGICIGEKVDLDELARRFPVAVLYRDNYRLLRNSGSGSLMSFGPNMKFCTFMNCAFIHRSSVAYRLKHVLYMAVLSKDLPQADALKHLNAVFCDSGQLSGMHFCDEGQTPDLLIAAQLQSMFLQPDLKETTLGQFLNTHKAILLRAFAAKDLIYEPYLIWQVPQPQGSEGAINPDFLLQRSDDYWDVMDLKTAALKRSDLTRGPRRRRRFVDYVNEGIAQLAHYREYLSIPENRQHAKDNYGVQFHEARFSLVVGNYENADPSRLEEASRQVRDIAIIDYDTLVQLFLASGSKPRSA